MSPPLLGVEGEGLKERNYLGLSDCSSVDSSAVSSVSEERKNNLNLKATELRLGLPGSQSPERESEFNTLNSGSLDEKQLFPLAPLKDGICSFSGNKRGFSDTVDGFSQIKSSAINEGNWMFGATVSNSGAPQSVGQAKLAVNSGANAVLPNSNQLSVKKELPSKTSQECTDKITGSGNTSAPAAKAQVVGWPPIRSFRKNTLATSSKNHDEVNGKPGLGTLLVKVSMDGAPYLRKVDLRTYSAYQELSSALEKMFSCFTIGQCASHEASGKEVLCESKLRDLLHGSEYVLTYEDKDGDWMLVGDVPWEMFIESCKRLKIMKGSDAIGLAPRAMEKSKNRS